MRRPDGASRWGFVVVSERHNVKSDPALALEGGGRQPPTARKPLPLAYWLHSLFGLKLSLFMAFVCLTGTIATLAHEIEWLYKPEVRASAYEPHAEDWGAMWAAAQRAYPEAKLTGIGSFDRNDSTYSPKASVQPMRRGRISPSMSIPARTA